MCPMTKYKCLDTCGFRIKINDEECCSLIFEISENVYFADPKKVSKVIELREKAKEFEEKYVHLQWI